MSGTETKIAVITGASSGIGRAIALKLAEEGWRVFAGVRSEEDAKDLESSATGKVQGVMLDVQSDKDVAALKDKLEKEGLSLDALVNNAGVAVSGAVETTSLEDYQRQFDINFFGAIRVTQGLLPLIRQAKGRVVNMSSMAGKVSQPYLSPYCASKHAIEALSDSLRIEMKPFGVNVSIIEPGAVQTPIWSKGTGNLEDALRDLDPEMRKLYGESLKSMGRVFEKAAEDGVEVSEVADAALHALTSDKPKSRYMVGKDATIGIIARRLLPDGLMDRAISKNFN